MVEQEDAESLYAQHFYVPEVAELFVLYLFGLFFKGLIKGECVFKKSLSAGLLQANKKTNPVGSR